MPRHHNVLAKKTCWSSKINVENVSFGIFPEQSTGHPRVYRVGAPDASETLRGDGAARPGAGGNGVGVASPLCFSLSVGTSQIFRGFEQTEPERVTGPSNIRIPYPYPYEYPYPCRSPVWRKYRRATGPHMPRRRVRDLAGGATGGCLCRRRLSSNHGVLASTRHPSAGDTT